MDRDGGEDVLEGGKETEEVRVIVLEGEEKIVSVKVDAITSMAVKV